MSTKHTSETRDRVRTLYAQLRCMSQVANRMGLPRSTCFSMVHGNSNVSKYRHEAALPHEEETIKSYVNAGLNDQQIGDVMGIGRYQVKWRRTKYGIPAGSSVKVKKDTPAQAADEYVVPPRLEIDDRRFEEAIAGREFTSFIMKGDRR